MKLREKTVLDLTVGDALKIIVIFKVARFSYRVFDKTCMVIVDKYELDKKLSDKIAQMTTDAVFPPKDLTDGPVYPPKDSQE